jgi:hypothetical protein
MIFNIIFFPLSLSVPEIKPWALHMLEGHNPWVIFHILYLVIVKYEMKGEFNSFFSLIYFPHMSLILVCQ